MDTPIALPISPEALDQLRIRDDAGRPCLPYRDPEGGAPLRCCLRRSRPGEQIALVSYAPLRRWAAAHEVDPGAYDELGPVFLHAEDCGGPEGEGSAFDEPGAVRVLRRYDAAGRILGGRVLALSPDRSPGTPESFRYPARMLREACGQAFADPAVALVHVRAAEFGCFLYEVRRR
ncbi:DUF1203 domain-containing protein [Streptomyces sp. NPDC006879]|uniref:DUF1203 domain-containing protein n=1 Tax=Streptomyces sp. NPDC006879 TaxID=3364767 RepID=UPI0036854BDE